jgi:hypothetical protein
MRDHAEYIATDGVGMSEDKLKTLRAFYRKLKDEGLVLEYDPSYPAVPGVSNKGGFTFRERVRADGDLLIRVNEFTNLTDEGREIWRFPAQDP